jgi:AcrR family transcriptional regulator
MDRRKSILEAAERSFSMFGYKASTVDQIAKIANVGKGTIYNFFANKEELFSEIITNFVKETKMAASKAIKEDRPFYENLHYALYEVIEFRKTHQLAVKLSQEVKEMNTSPVTDGLLRIEKAVLSFVQRELDKAVEKGEIKDCPTDIVAFMMVKLYLALIFDWERENPAIQKEKMLEVLEMFVMDGLRKES